MTQTEIHPRIVEILDALTQAQREMEDTLTAIPAAHHDAPTADGVWSIAQIVEHLLILEDGAGRLISTLIKQADGTVETDETPVAHSIDQFQVWNPVRRIEAPDSVAPTSGITLSAALDQQRVARARMMEAFRRGSGRALATVAFPHPVVGPLNAYQWGLMVAQHQRRHLVQMRAVSASLSA